MRVIVACECSGRVRDAFRARGHDAWSCDLMPCESDPEWHYQSDILSGILDKDWDLMIGHPPCDFLTNSGNRWLYETCSRGTPEQRVKDRENGILFFLALWNCPIPRICLENPRPHPYVVSRIGPPNQVIQPWEFGEKATKATCLWLRGLPPLMATIIEQGKDRKPLVHREPPGPKRKSNRSRTYEGIAQAMAKQWSCLNT